MITDSEHNVSDLTKVLIKRVHGGRKQHTRFYQSALDDKQLSPAAVRSGPSLLQQILFLALGLVVGLFLVLFFKNYTFSSIIDLLPFAKNDSVIVVPDHNESDITLKSIPPSKSKPLSPPQQQPRELIFTEAQKRKAIEEVIEERRKKPAQYIASSNQSESAYQYKIDLFSGGTIYTDNADIGKDTITYKSASGLVISINRNEIKSMKWVKAY